jgi:RimJ/RimL family protein N-acetyltransferase
MQEKKGIRYLLNNVSIRKFCKEDIENKVKWINDERNNKYLHYDLPLDLKKTQNWFDNNINNNSRFDAVIMLDDIPVGVIGLLSINDESAEYYITIGEQFAKGKGVGKAASYLLLDYAFDNLMLKKVTLYTEVDNVSAQKLFERVGFIKIGLEKDSALNRGKFVDRYYYEATKESVELSKEKKE